jgi:hypothetical protein
MALVIRLAVHSVPWNFHGTVQCLTGGNGSFHRISMEESCGTFLLFCSMISSMDLSMELP